MNDAVYLGKAIREKRLTLNLRMDDVARQANISRVTLTNIEKGKGGYSITALLDVLKILDLYMELGNLSSQNDRNRATRINTKLDKKINHFIVMCVEQYAESVNLPSEEVYKEMNQKGIIEYFRLEYEDLHGMSTEFLNQYIGGLLSKKHGQKVMGHALAKALIFSDVIEMFSKDTRISINEARDIFYESEFVKMFSDDSLGLFGESPLYIYSLYKSNVSKY